LVEGIDRADLGPITHPAVGAFILVDLDIDSAGKLLMPPKNLDPSQRTIRETSFTADASIFTNLHIKSPFQLSHSRKFIYDRILSSTPS
jgi:hypothetical protein